MTTNKWKKNLVRAVLEELQNTHGKEAAKYTQVLRLYDELLEDPEFRAMGWDGKATVTYWKFEHKHNLPITHNPFVKETP